MVADYAAPLGWRGTVPAGPAASPAARPVEVDAEANDTRVLGPGDVEAAAVSLGEAFGDDPVMGWLGGFEDAPARVTTLMRAQLTAQVARPECLAFTTAGHAANAIWNPPGHAGPSTTQLLRSLPRILSVFRTGVRRLPGFLAAAEAAHPDEPHYYLAFVGVRRSARGAGLGAAVLQPMLDRCDTEGIGAYLENSRPQNAAFYSRLGFVEIAPIALPEGAPRLTSMWRAPR